MITMKLFLGLMCLLSSAGLFLAKHLLQGRIGDAMALDVYLDRQESVKINKRVHDLRLGAYVCLIVGAGLLAEHFLIPPVHPTATPTPQVVSALPAKTPHNPSLFKVRVLTAEGQPVFYVPDSYSAEDIDREVDRRFGVQPNGNGHNWYGGD